MTPAIQQAKNAFIDLLNGMVAENCTPEEQRDVLDYLAGRIEARLEKLDEEEIAENRDTKA